MTGARLTFTDQAAVAELSRLARAAADMTPAYDAIGSYLVFSTQRRFETETGPDGTPWPPLSPRTAKARVGRRQRGTEHMLRVSLRLYRSISYAADASSAEVGSNVVYAGIHQFGGTIRQGARRQTVSLKTIRKKGAARSRFVRPGTKGAVAKLVTVKAHSVTIPARPYLGLSDADRQEIVTIVTDHIRDEAGK